MRVEAKLRGRRAVARLAQHRIRAGCVRYTDAESSAVKLLTLIFACDALSAGVEVTGAAANEIERAGEPDRWRTAGSCSFCRMDAWRGRLPVDADEACALRCRGAGFLAGVR